MDVENKIHSVRTLVPLPVIDQVIEESQLDQRKPTQLSDSFPSFNNSLLVVPKVIKVIKNTIGIGSKRVLLIECGAPATSIYGSPRAIGIEILDDLASKEGFKTIMFNTQNDSLQDILQEVKEGDIVALSSLSPGFKTAFVLGKAIKEKFQDKVLVIKGGLHETFVGERYQTTISNYPIDISFLGDVDICFGDFLRIVKNATFRSNLELFDELNNLSPIAFKGKAGIVKKGNVKGNDFVFPELRHLELSKPFTIFRSQTSNDLMIRVMSTRGCPECCTFCNVGARDTVKVNSNKLIDYIGNVIDEHEVLETGKHIRYVFFEDGTFITEKKNEGRILYQSKYSSDEWFSILSDETKKLNDRLVESYGFNLSFAFQTTIPSILNGVPTLKKLKEVGLESVYIGVETLFDDKRKSVSKSGTGEDCIKAIEILHSLGINTSCSTMVDLGSEECATYTIEELMKRGVLEVFNEYRAVYPGTPDSRRVLKWVNKLGEGYFGELFTQEEIEDLYSRGRIHSGSVNFEDKSKLVAKLFNEAVVIISKGEELFSDEHSRKALLVLVDNDILCKKSSEYYEGLRRIATSYGYEVLNNGHYRKIV